MALLEETLVDAAQGGFVSHDLAQYHIATNADVQDIDAVWLAEDDPHLNPMGAKGIGEIGITGTAAAIGNAVYHATGRRVRDLPDHPRQAPELAPPVAGALKPGCALRLAGGDWRCLRWLECGGKQVAGRQAAVGPPFLGDGDDLLLGGAVVELIGGLDGLTEREVARQDDVSRAAAR